MHSFKPGIDLYRTSPETPLRFLQFVSYACAPCQAIRNKLDDWILCHSGVDSLYISVEDYPDVAAQQGVFTVPTIFLIVNGQLTLRESGYFSLDALLEKAERYRSFLLEEAHP